MSAGATCCAPTSCGLLSPRPFPVFPILLSVPFGYGFGEGGLRAGHEVFAADEEGLRPRFELKAALDVVYAVDGLLAVAHRQRRGFGQELIERVLPYELGARTALTFAPGGVRCEIDLPLNQRTASISDADRKPDEEPTYDN